MAFIERRTGKGSAMKIILMGTGFTPEKYADWHVLSAVDVERPALAEVQGDAGARPSLTRLPPWIAHDRHYVRTPQALREFRQILADFIEANRTTIRASKVVINLNGTTQPLPFDFVKAIWDVFRQNALHDPIEVVVFTPLVR
jgi:enoyl-CoA hydratase/carnithine racemase